ncbi:MAG: galactose-1-phosphate uridylyltransferase [Candidatus Pacebacteria bacterium]|nr:galactose-1-phosphate uridylyltransferase [Candidatus Paceibacterota bacterium]
MQKKETGNEHVQRAEFRKDLVSGDWILIANTARGKRPELLKQKVAESKDDKSKCPFEDPQKSGNPIPLLWFPSPDTPPAEWEDFNSWFVQVIPNKYPLLYHEGKCPDIEEKEGRLTLGAVGYHEVIITRDHEKTLADMSIEEIVLVLKAYKERYRVLAKDPCMKFILIFHNHGEAAGASLAHPHSQLVGMPIIDPDVSSSLKGSAEFFKENKKCVHCVMIEQEMKDGERVLRKNDHFITVVPFAPRVSYETRIYPLEHASRFEDLDKDLFIPLAEALKDALTRLNKALGNPDYNFFIHTSPVGKEGDYGHYHWHIEILPRGFKWAGLELGSGVEVVAVSPEIAADHLKEVLQ